MEMNRRQFIEKVGHGVVGTAIAAATIGGSAFLITGCAFSIAEILNWTKVGSGTIGSVINLLVGAGILACATCSVAANVALAAITAIGAAVQNYQNAAAADKATLLGKIQTALQAALSASTAFFEALSIPGANLAALVAGLAGLVINAIAGFIGQVGTPVPTPATFKLNAKSTPIIPTVWKSSNAFKSRVNHMLIQFGHPEEVQH